MKCNLYYDAKNAQKKNTTRKKKSVFCMNHDKSDITKKVSQYELWKERGIDKFTHVQKK